MSNKIQEIIKQYGKLALYTHITYSLMFYAGIYFLISRKYVDPDILMKKIGIDTENNKTLKLTGDAAISYFIYKATMPMRIPFTVVTVPIIAKILKRR